MLLLNCSNFKKSLYIRYILLKEFTSFTLCRRYSISVVHICQDSQEPKCNTRKPDVGRVCSEWDCISHLLDYSYNHYSECISTFVRMVVTEVWIILQECLTLWMQGKQHSFCVMNLTSKFTINQKFAHQLVDLNVHLSYNKRPLKSVPIMIFKFL